MNKNIEEYIAELKKEEGGTFSCDEESLKERYQMLEDNQSGIAIKILSIFGGLLGMITFLIALGIAGFLDEGMSAIVLGVFCLIGAIILNRVTKTIFLDTISVAAFVTGFTLFDFGLFELNVDESFVCILNILIAVISLVFSKNYVYTFLAILILQISVLFLITINELHNLVHLYIAVNIAVLTVWIMNEGKIIGNNKELSNHYAPIRIGLIFSLIIGLGLIGIKGFYLNITGVNLTWISSMATFPIMLYLVSVILNILEINSTQSKGIVYAIVVLILATIVNAPAISGAMVLLLLCFYANYQTGIVISIIALVYFVGQYYYDLNLTLLTKSIILFSSGVLFLMLYFLTHKKLETHETH